MLLLVILCERSLINLPLERRHSRESPAAEAFGTALQYNSQFVLGCYTTAISLGFVRFF